MSGEAAAAATVVEVAEPGGRGLTRCRSGPGPGVSVVADIHATSARRFHPSAVQPIAAAVSREQAIYDVKTRPSL